MNKNTGWIISVAVIGIVLLGLWWAYGRDAALVDGQNATQNAATTTENGATSTPIVRENRGATTVSGVIASLPEASTFASYLSATGVALSANGTYTVFVPSNAAFGKLPAGTVSNLSASAKKRLVQYHIVSGKKIDVDAIDASTIQALSTDMLNFQAYGGSAGGMVNSAIVLRQYNAKNGVVYIVNSVLLPPLPPLN